MHTGAEEHPGKNDNKGLQKNAPSDEVRKKIVEGRIKALEEQIGRQQGELEKVQKTLEKAEK